jgi:UDP-N-acetyl-D-galactosamine dehydrogenase
MHEYGVALVPWAELPPAKAIVAAVSHAHYRSMPLDELTAKLVRGGVFADVKASYDRAKLEKLGHLVWRL